MSSTHLVSAVFKAYNKLVVLEPVAPSTPASGSKGINAVAFEPGVVRTNFGTGSIKFVEFAYHSFLKYFFTISPEKSAKRLVKLATGIPGKDFVAGKTYTKDSMKNMKFKFKDENGIASKALWDESEKMLKRYIM